MTQQETKAVEDAVKKLNWLETNAFIKGAQFLDELRKPSEPETNVGKAGEELVKRIKEILDTTFTNSADFSRVSTEIAALMQPDNELLEAAKDALRTFYGIGCNEEAEIVQVLTKAILNYEKQRK